MIRIFQSNVKSYEYITEGYSSYQEFIDANPIQTKVQSLGYPEYYRIGEIANIQNNYQKGIDQVTTFAMNTVPGANFYTDVIFMMMCELDKK